MRGQDEQQLGVFSYVSPEQRIPHDHPLRQLLAMADEALRELKPRFSRLYAKTGRPSIAPEKLLRALLLQVLYSVRSERMLMEQLDYSLLFRWFSVRSERMLMEQLDYSLLFRWFGTKHG